MNGSRLVTSKGEAELSGKRPRELCSSGAGELRLSVAAEGRELRLSVAAEGRELRIPRSPFCTRGGSPVSRS